MRKLVVGIFAVSLVLTLAGRSLAADTANVTVTATVLDTCFFTSAGDLAFGGIDPGVAGPYNAAQNSDVNVQCGVGTGFAITDDGGLNGPPGGPYAMDDITTGLQLLTYTLTYTAAGVGAGFGTDVPLNIAATMTQAAAQAVVPDDYDDTVVLSVLP